MSIEVQPTLVSVAGLGPDEIAVVVALIERLRMGRAQYGELCIRDDRRDWRRECFEEAADLAIYATVGLIARGR